MKTSDKGICSRLAEERKRLHLNQARVADYCEVSSKTVSRWEKNIPIPADKLSMLALLGYDITYVLTSVKLASKFEGFDEVSRVFNTESGSHPARRKSDHISDEQTVWLSILEHLADGNRERLKQIGLTMIGYSQARR